MYSASRRPKYECNFPITITKNKAKMRDSVSKNIGDDEPVMMRFFFLTSENSSNAC